MIILIHIVRASMILGPGVVGIVARRRALIAGSAAGAPDALLI